MNYTKQELKQGINLHIINTNKFKTNLIAVFLSIPLSRDAVTKNALLTAILRRGTKNLKTQEEISMALEKMYGASFDCGIEKTGDNHVIKFYLEALNEEFLPDPENILKQSIDTIFDIAFNPLVEGEGFKNEYLKGEKENLRQIIDGKKDNKATYSTFRCIEEMYKNKPYGLYKYGYSEDLDNIDAESLYRYYKKLINECKIDIFVSGLIEQDVKKIIMNNENIIKLEARKAKYIINNETTEEKQEKEEKTVVENMDVTQGKVVIGMDVLDTRTNFKYTGLVYNAILGGTATSKMFQNVREKESLAYTAGSSYLRVKNNIFIKCGIEIKNFERVIDLIKIQLEDMKKGNFTDEDIINAKRTIQASIVSIPEEQDTEITFYFGQELSNTKLKTDEYLEKIKSVTKENIIDFANKTKIDTIYFLRD